METAVATSFVKKSSYSHEELLASGNREFGQDIPPLPLPPMLMFDRITTITGKGGDYNKGFVEAELDINPNLWFFKAHFKADPVMPGCLGLDAMWQLLGFFLVWSGARGYARALGVGTVDFTGEVTGPSVLVKYRIDIQKFRVGKASIGFADGKLFCDGNLLYQVKNLKTGAFPLETKP